MKLIKNRQLSLGILFIAFLSTSSLLSQTYSVNNKESNLEILGTSSIHDWEISAEQKSGTISLQTENGILKSIKSLDFTVLSKSLKSGKSAMDKNTYKALDADRYKEITFQLENVYSIKNTSDNNYKIDAKGYLNIAGTKKPVNLIFDLKLKDNAVSLSGSTSLKMSDYKIDAPTAMFGTITTGDQITIKYKTIFTK